jgi:hypothetical protein
LDGRSDFIITRLSNQICPCGECPEDQTVACRRDWRASLTCQRVTEQQPLNAVGGLVMKRQNKYLSREPVEKIVSFRHIFWNMAILIPVGRQLKPGRFLPQVCSMGLGLENRTHLAFDLVHHNATWISRFGSHRMSVRRRPQFLAGFRARLSGDVKLRGPGRVCLLNLVISRPSWSTRIPYVCKLLLFEFVGQARLRLATRDCIHFTTSGRSSDVTRIRESSRCR